MTLRRRRPHLSVAWVELLLAGDSTTDPFLEFEVSQKDIDEAWQRHGDELRAEATRLGLPVPKGRER